MSNLEIEVFTDRVKAFTDEEMEIVLRNIPVEKLGNEISRRCVDLAKATESIRQMASDL